MDFCNIIKIELFKTIMTEANPYFVTPLYRDIPAQTPSLQPIPVSKSNYNIYNLYVLRTRLEVLTRRQWHHSDIHFIFESIEYAFNDEPKRLYIQARPTIGDKTLDLNLAQLKQYQAMIKAATNTPLDYAVMFSNKDYRYEDLVISGDWILNVLVYIPFTSQDPTIKHRFGEYGFEVNVYPYNNTGYPSYPADDYNDIKNLDDYIGKLTDIRVALENEFVRWFKRGVVIEPTTDIIQSWDLKAIKPKVYQLNWIDRRITDPFNGRWYFINSRIMGSKSVLLPVDSNLVMLHRVAKLFYNQEYIPSFYIKYLKIKVQNYKETNSILKKIENISDEIGKVAVFRVTMTKFIPAYTKIAKDMDLNNIVFYYRDGVYGKELFCSCELSDLDLDVQIIIHKIQRQTLKYIS